MASSRLTPRWRSLLFALTAALGFGTGALLLAATGDRLARGALLSAPLVALAVVVAASVVTAQRAFQAGAVTTALPTIAAVEPVVAVSLAGPAGTEELAHLTVAAKMEEGLGLVRPLSMATEERVLGALGELCEARLAGFETTLEEDERLLLDEKLSRNTRNCLLLLRGEKRLLLAYAGLARTFLPPRSSAPPDDSAEAEGECP